MDHQMIRPIHPFSAISFALTLVPYFCLGFLLSCGGGTSEGEVVSGSWSACSNSTMHELDFSAGHLSQFETFYRSEDGSCTGELSYQTELSMETLFGAEVAENLFEIDVTYLSASYTIHSAALVDDANELRMGGYADWEVGVGKDVSGQTLPLGDSYPAKGEIRLGLLSVEGIADDLLRLRLVQTGASRPTDLGAGLLVYAKD